MSSFLPGDRVHLARVGSGIVREMRNGGRCVVEIKGRMLVVTAEQLQSAPVEHRPRAGHAATADDAVTGTGAVPAVSLDLHGRTVAEALDALDAFLNEALVADAAQVRIIHGRGGGAIKAAVHRRLGQLPPVRSFRVDPRNGGVTIVTF